MLEFFRALWPDGFSHGSGANLTIWTWPDKQSRHIPLVDFLGMSDEDLAELHAINEIGPGKKPRDVYFGLGLRRDGLKSNQQGARGDVVVIPGFAIDIDLHSDDRKIHNAENLPRTLVEAYDIFEHAPDPTAIVDSGHGLHVYWRFRTPLICAGTALAGVERAYEHFWTPFHERAAARGWQLDKTTTVQRVWRVPGFINHKDPKKQVKISELHLDIKASIGVERFAKAPPAAIASTIRDPRRHNVDLSHQADGGVLVLPQGGVPGTAQGVDSVIRALQNLHNPERKALFVKVLAGESFADEQRDVAMQRVCSTVGWIGRDVPTDGLLEILRPSLTVWTDEPGAVKTIGEELAKARDKIDRAKRDWHQKNGKAIAVLRQVIGAKEGKAPAPEADGEPEPDPDMPNILRHVVIQFRTSYYVFDFRVSRYSSPRIREELLQTMRDCCPPDSPVSFRYLNADGEWKEKKPANLLKEYCTVTANLVLDLTISHSRYDAVTQTFYEATAPQRELTARHDPKIEAWLNHLGGESASVLTDWVACVTRLDRQCCALYLNGKKGSGKGLLAAGLSRIWRDGGPTELTAIVGNFNGDIAECPFAFLDEGLPKGVDATIEIRKMVGEEARTLKRKFLPNACLVGTIRILIGANNDNVLNHGDSGDKTVRDLEAHVERFLYVDVSDDASEYLKTELVKDPELTRRWVAGDLLARHAIWLRENRKVTHGTRWLVEGKERGMHRKSITQGTGAGLVLEWICRFVDRPDSLLKVYKTQAEKPRALVGDGRILVNTQGMIDHWNLYMRQDIKIPLFRSAADMLRNMSIKEVRYPHTAGIRFHEIRTDIVLEHCKQNQLGVEERMRAAIEGPLPC